jgi:Predicted membrane protein
MRAITFVEQRSPRLAGLIALPATRQLLRYAFAGLCVTQFAACIYSGAVLVLRTEPVVANMLSTALGLVVGYFVHSRWSFATGSAERDGWQIGRFLLASAIGFLINSMWVLLLTKTLHLSPLAPVPLMMVATPWISFLLNRRWVFKTA